MLHRPGHPPLELAQEATAIGWGGDAILIASGGRVRLHDGKGALLRELATPGRALQLARDATRLAIALGDGRVVVQSAGAQVVLRDVPTSPPTALRLGPTPETITAGFENGQLGIWSLQNGERLELQELHGAVRHLAVQNSAWIHAATELGGHLSLDLSELRVPYCRLVQAVWARVPTVWEEGLPVLRVPPAAHPCAR